MELFIIIPHQESNKLNLKPNKFEKNFLIWLKDNIKGAWEYTGDFSFWVKNKNPDIIDKNRKIAIELFGDYWHILHSNKQGISIKEYERKYQIHYTLNGWNLIIVWFSEFVNGTFKDKFKQLDWVK